MILVDKCTGHYQRVTIKGKVSKGVEKTNLHITPCSVTLVHIKVMFSLFVRV